MKSDNIIKLLPYGAEFLFVDKLTMISTEMVEGYYTFKKDEYFYQSHFKENPVTPGVILIECMAQIGLVCLGIYLLNSEEVSVKTSVAFSSSQVDFLIPVFPGEKVNVVSEKVYFRFNKLKCKVKMFNEKGELVANGELSGMVKKYE
ncbi:3-hydroxyacyl-ACP dehydratase FabZ family protein [Aequorivita sinensis]|uniref:3-hydroxyacyl-ACP dehydratase FabZ family protein n=1 Tax=Aequorivita sinensis TaxID=1382458 RepID=UPI0011203FED|nr:3-hydroxyacyl-ACP dehydratase FabZ family protein [Aequorivita sinensis]